jgi:hypothetical protein
LLNLLYGQAEWVDGIFKEQLAKFFDFSSKVVSIVAEELRIVSSKGVKNKIMIVLDLAFQVAHS